jgi:hypothetical protein
MSRAKTMFRKKSQQHQVLQRRVEVLIGFSSKEVIATPGQSSVCRVT